MLKICKVCNKISNKFHGKTCIDCFNQARRKPHNTSKSCKYCGNLFNLRVRQIYCDACRKLRDQEIYEIEKEYSKQYYHKNKEQILEQLSQNRNSISRSKRNKYRNAKRKNDLCFKMRDIVSTSIRLHLKINGSSKNKNSITQYLPYSIQELKNHLEKKFESWMTWNNWGIYNKNTWNDNNQSTWVWNIDHIIPHSTFKYTSMTEQSFRDCWSLENLKPLGAKQNLIKHNKVN